MNGVVRDAYVLSQNEMLLNIVQGGPETNLGRSRIVLSSCMSN